MYVYILYFILDISLLTSTVRSFCWVAHSRSQFGCPQVKLCFSLLLFHLCLASCFSHCYMEVATKGNDAGNIENRRWHFSDTIAGCCYKDMKKNRCLAMCALDHTHTHRHIQTGTHWGGDN